MVVSRSGILEGLKAFSASACYKHAIYMNSNVCLLATSFLPFPLHTKAVTNKMQTLELVRLSSSRTTCASAAAASALQGGSGDTTEDDLTTINSNICQNIEGSSPIFVAVRIRPGTQMTKGDDEKWKAITVQRDGKQVIDVYIITS